MMQGKLTQAQLSAYRDHLLKEQDGICALCEEKIESDPVLDHCHKSGHVRAVLHRTCNSLEGKIANWVKCFGKSADMSIILKNLIAYQSSDFSDKPLHPKHRTVFDKEIKKLQGLAKSAKRPETVKKHKEAIRSLKSKIERVNLDISIASR